MPPAEKMPLAHRIGPLLAGAVKTTARRYYEQGMTPREVAARILVEQDVTVTAPAIHVWARNGDWIQGEREGRPKRIKPSTSEKAKAEAAKKCLKRCPVCLRLTEPGATHVCQIEAGRIISIFGGSFL